jgi:hypothetical protein
MAQELKKELRALRTKAKQKENPKVMKAYQKLVSTLR